MEQSRGGGGYAYDELSALPDERRAIAQAKLESLRELRSHLPCLRHRSAKLATGCVWKSTAVLPCSSAPDHERDSRSTAAVIFPAVLPPAILFATATFVLSVLSLRRAMDRPPALLSHPRRLHRPLQTMARIRISRRGSGTRLPLVCGWPRRS
jgi:hypothetical protein